MQRQQQPAQVRPQAVRRSMIKEEYLFFTTIFSHPVKKCHPRKVSVCVVCPFFWPVTLFYFPAGCLEEIHLFKENKCFTFPIFLPAEIAVRFGSGPSCCCGGDIFHEPQKKGPPYPVEAWFCRCQLAELGLLLCTGPGHKVSSPPASGIALHDANNTIFINSYQQSYFMFKCLYFCFFFSLASSFGKSKNTHKSTLADLGNQIYL